MLTKNLISVSYYAYNMLIKTEYEMIVLRSKGSQH